MWLLDHLVRCGPCWCDKSRAHEAILCPFFLFIIIDIYCTRIQGHNSLTCHDWGRADIYCWEGHTGYALQTCSFCMAAPWRNLQAKIRHELDWGCSDCVTSHLLPRTFSQTCLNMLHHIYYHMISHVVPLCLLHLFLYGQVLKLGCWLRQRLLPLTL